MKDNFSGFSAGGGCGLLLSVARRAAQMVAADKALVLEVTVPAPLGAVWQAFTTSEGLSTWLTPGAVVDLREGGEWTAHFPGGSTGGGTILSFVPEKELVSVRDGSG